MPRSYGENTKEILCTFRVSVSPGALLKDTAKRKVKPMQRGRTQGGQVRQDRVELGGTSGTT